MLENTISQAIVALTNLSETNEDPAIRDLIVVLDKVTDDVSGTVETSTTKMVTQNISIVVSQQSVPDELADLLREIKAMLGSASAEKETPQTIFISYGRDDDEDFVKRLHEDLSKAGFEVWWDRKAMESRGRTFLHEIRDAIEDVDRLLLVVGPEAANSKYVRMEVEHAVRLCKGVIPVLRLGDYDLFPAELSLHHGPDFRSDDDYEDALQELVRLLTTPTAPLGPLCGPPTLPAQYVLRPDVLQEIADHVLADINRPTLMSADDRTTAVQGMGGVGKSVVAAAFAHDCDTRRAFEDGIIWLSVTKTPDMRLLFELAGRELGDDPREYPDLEVGSRRLHRILEDKACLIILDDVWDRKHIEPFQLDAPRCRVLFTTRDSTIALSMGVAQMSLQVMGPEQGVALLQQWVGEENPELEQVAERLGYLPLALKLAGARLREGMSTQEWLETFHDVSLMKLGRRSSGPSEDLQVCFKMSTEQLLEDDQLLYYTLGIFQEDIWIPRPVVTLLWQALNPSMEEFDCHELVTDLHRLALIDLSTDKSGIGLHDLLHDYTRNELGEDGTKIHGSLLDAYNPDPDSLPWYKLPQDNKHQYLFQHLAHHMINAGRKEALYSILIEAPQWMENRFSKGREQTLEHLALHIWDLYYEDDEDSARAFLMSWLSSQRATHVSKEVAVHCAFNARESTALAVALRDSDELVQDIAVKFVLYLDEIDPGSSTEAIRIASQNVKRFGLPNPRILRILIPLVVIMMIEQYRRMANESQPDPLGQLTGILRDMMRRAMYVDRGGKGPIRLVGNAGRTMLVNLMKQRIRKLLSHNLEEVEANPEQLRITVNSVEEFARFFEASVDHRELVHGLIPYLDRSYGSLSEIRDQVLSVFASQDQLSISFVNSLIMARARSEISAIYDLYRHVFESINEEHRNDPNLTAYTAGSIAHALFTSFDRQTEIEEDWLAFLKEAVRQHFDNPSGYGITRTAVGRYIYHSPMYYGAIWNKVHPGQEIDLVQEYLRRAEQEKDRRLLLYMIDSLGERGTFPSNYQGILRSLEPFVGTDDEEIEDHLVRTLAVIRNKRPDQVDHFLSHKATEELAAKVRGQSFDEPITELARRFHEFVADFLMYSEPGTVQRVVAAIEHILQQQTLDEAMEVATKEAMNGILGEKVFFG